MAQTQVQGKQLRLNTVQRKDLDTTTTTKAVATKIVAGAGVTISFTGADSGTGVVTING